MIGFGGESEAALSWGKRKSRGRRRRRDKRRRVEKIGARGGRGRIGAKKVRRERKAW